MSAVQTRAPLRQRREPAAAPARGVKREAPGRVVRGAESLARAPAAKRRRVEPAARVKRGFPAPVRRAWRCVPVEARVEGPVRKRARVMDCDVDMREVEGAVGVWGRERGKRRRRKTLREVLVEGRARGKVPAVVGGAVVEPTATGSGGGAKGGRGLGESTTVGVGAAPGPPFKGFNMANLTGDEEVIEVIDASECSDMGGSTTAHGGWSGAGETSAAPAVEAALLEDGRCAVRILRPDGTVQVVVIQPPEV